VTQSNAASAEESASAAGQLSLQAGNLLSAVEDMTALIHGAKAGPIARKARPAPGRQAPPRAAAGRPRPAPAAAKALPMDDDFDF
jgi:methyl-accepting chemotaxis protein